MDPLKVGLAIPARKLAEQARQAVQRPAAEVVVDGATGQKLLDEVQRTRAEVVVLAGSDPGLIGSLRRVPFAPRVVVVSESLDPDEILAAMRAGASEYVSPPDASGITAALERLSRELRADGAGRPGRVVGFLSVKGGCGATTLACHVAAEIQPRASDKILLADLDLSCGLIRFLMRCEGPYSVADAIRNTGRLDASYWRALVTEKSPGLEIVTAPSDDCTEEAHDPAEMGRVLRFAKTQYAWIVADLGRGLGATARHAERELDELLLVSTLEIAALNRARAAVRALLDTGVQREKLKLLLNRAPARTDLHPDEIKRAVGIPVFDTVPDRAKALEEACADGRLLAQEDPARARCGRIADKLMGSKPKTRPRTLFGIPIGR